MLASQIMYKGSERKRAFPLDSTNQRVYKSQQKHVYKMFVCRAMRSGCEATRDGASGVDALGASDSVLCSNLRPRLESPYV